MMVAVPLVDGHYIFHDIARRHCTAHQIQEVRGAPPDGNLRAPLMDDSSHVLHTLGVVCDQACHSDTILCSGFLNRLFCQQCTVLCRLWCIFHPLGVREERAAGRVQCVGDDRRVGHVTPAILNQRDLGRLGQRLLHFFLQSSMGAVQQSSSQSLTVRRLVSWSQTGDQLFEVCRLTCVEADIVCKEEPCHFQVQLFLVAATCAKCPICD